MGQGIDFRVKSIRSGYTFLDFILNQPFLDSVVLLSVPKKNLL